MNFLQINYNTYTSLTRDFLFENTSYQQYLMPIAFTLLFLLMLLYWSEAAFFGFELVGTSKDSKQRPNASEQIESTFPSKKDFHGRENFSRLVKDYFYRLSWQRNYKKVIDVVETLSILSLTLLMLFRWFESGHFPLSNLYESLLFLSLSFLALKVLFLAISPHRSSTEKNLLPSVLHTSVSKNDASFLKGFLTSNDNLQNYALHLGVILSPLALLTFGFAFLSLPKEMQRSTALVPALQSNWLMMHVTVMVLSYAALLSGSILSIAFLILNRSITHSNQKLENTGLVSSRSQNSTFVPINQQINNKANLSCFAGASSLTQEISGENPTELDSRKNLTKNISDTSNTKLRFGFSNKISRVSEITAYGAAPSAVQSALDPSNAKDSFQESKTYLCKNLDNLSYRILALGFPLLTIGILSGAVWANEAWGSYWSWDPKETWALITWLVFAIYLHTRITKGWNGEKSAMVAMVGFFMVWFCYLGVNLLGNGLHSYGWFSS